MTTSKAFLAKYAGKCPNCGNRYVAGKEWLRFVDNVLQHVQCPTDGHGALGTSVKTITSKKVEPVYQSSFNMPINIKEDKKDSLGDALQSALDNFQSDKEDHPDFDIDLQRKVDAKGFIPSQYQQAIFDAITEMVNGVYAFAHLVIEAVAGSGKTTTIVKALELIPAQFDVFFLAFNKHIATELSKRCQSKGLDNVFASTLHALGLKNFRKVYPDFNPKTGIVSDKVMQLLNDIYPVSRKALNDGLITKEERKANFAKRSGMRNLVSICKSTLVDYNNQKAILEVIERYSTEIETKYFDEVIDKLPEIMELCKSKVDIIDFDDMIWLPVVLNLPLEQCDFLMVDEAQDMNKLQIAFILRLVKESGHIIAVGDRYQSLYGFRGADTNAIQNIIDMLKANVLPLSVTYRCPRLHVERAQKIVPQLEARDNAPEGVIRDIQYYDFAKEVQPGDMVVCRTNAPLIKPAFECIRMHKKAVIRGMDFRDALINLIDKFETNDLNSFEISLMEYFTHEHQKLLDNAKEMQAVLLEDKVKTIRFVATESSTVIEMKEKIKMLFSDDATGVIFASVHRAKGGEADNVFILRPDLMPHKKAKKDWEKAQEQNCIYVAETRSKNQLVYVRGGENA